VESVAIPSTPSFASRARFILSQAVGPIRDGAVGNPPKLQDLKAPVGGQEPLPRIAVAYVKAEAEQHAGGQSG